MSLKTVRLCIVCVVICLINCDGNPIGKPKTSTQDQDKPQPSKDVFKDVAKILSDANDEAKKSSLDSNRTKSEGPTIRLRHPKHIRRNPFARVPRDQDMLKDAPNRVLGDAARKRKSSKPRDWRPEWDSPQPASYSAYPYQPYEYISHPYYNYHYSGYDNWYSSQIPNYHAYNVPPEQEWKTTVHEGPDVEWIAHIAFPDMEPIIITNKNYTSSKSNVNVVINKSEPKNGRTNGARHVPVPGPKNIDPNAMSSTRYSYSPSLTPSANRNKHGKHSFEPITWTATVDYPNSAPVIMKGVIPQVPGPVHYVNPPPQIAGPGYYYPAPAQWPAPAYNTNPWMYGGYPVLANPAPAYPILTNPPPVFEWPSVAVLYPSVESGAYPPYSPPQGGKPPLKSDDDDDDDDDDDEDDDKGDDENGKDDEDDGDDNGDEKDEDEDEDVAKVPDSEEASGNDDREAESTDDVIDTEPKKGFFSWG